MLQIYQISPIWNNFNKINRKEYHTLPYSTCINRAV
nr:MAG TPA: hypothetical protein [Caudoviricetes sp.]